MSSDAAYFGIDFGTTNSSMAWYDPQKGEAKILRNAEGEEKTPSLVYYSEEDDEVLIGKPAEEQLDLLEETDDPQERDEIARRLVRSVKRNLLNPPLIPIPGREPVRPVEVVALILGKLKGEAEKEHFYEEIERVVITCPAIFGSRERDVLLQAAEMAGFGTVEVLQEPVAAALAVHRLGQKVGKGVLVYDLGAGTFDLSVVARDEEGSFYVPMEPEGDDRFGGDDLDLALYRYCDGIARGGLGRPISPTGQIDPVFRKQCRARKESLSNSAKSRFGTRLLSEDGAPERFRHEIDRETFEALIRDRIEGTVHKTARLLERAEEQGHEVDTVVLIGGSSRVPLVRRLLAEALPVEPHNFAEKDYAVALGAAYHAFELWNPASPKPKLEAGDGADREVVRSQREVLAPVGQEKEPEDRRDEVLHETKKGAQNGGWKLAGASVRGKLHAHNATWREGSFDFGFVDGWTMIAVSDGAVSAPLSRVGSRLACEHALAHLKEYLRGFTLTSESVEGLQKSEGPRLYEFLAGAASAALAAIRREAGKRSRQPEDFAGTLLVVVQQAWGGQQLVAAIQVGDGIVALLEHNGDATLLGKPDHGEHSRFLTTRSIEETFMKRVSVSVKEHLRCVAVMSDGVSDDFFPEEKRIGELFISEELPGMTTRDERPLRGVLHTVLPNPDPAAALLEWLRYEKRGSSENRTLVLLWDDNGEAKQGGSARVKPALNPGGWSLDDVRDVEPSRTFTRYSDPVGSVAFSPDGQLIASGGKDGPIKLWDAKTGERLRTFTGHSNWVLSVVFSPDGRLLASGGVDRTIKLWDAKTGEPLRTLTGHSNGVYSVAFSPDGQLLASGCNDKTIKVWEVQTDAPLHTLTGHSRGVNSVAFSPDGQLLASGSADKTIKLWNAKTGAPLRTLTGHSSYIESVGFSPDGQLLVSGSHDETIKLWETQTGALLRTLTEYAGWVLSVVFSPDGRLLASGRGNGKIKLWEVQTGALLRTLDEGGAYPVNSVAFSPDGRLLASGSGFGTIRLWKKS